jgi:enoyl-CoA hydratase
VTELKAALTGTAWDAGAEQAQVEAVLARFNTDPGPPPLAEKRTAIDRCFAGDSVEVILAALEAETSDPRWAAATRASLLTKSPASLRITLRQLILGRDMDLEDALKLEYRMTQHVMAAHDFYEGVRAALVDKDQTPRWRPATLAGFREAAAEAYFASLGGGELTFD